MKGGKAQRQYKHTEPMTENGSSTFYAALSFFKHSHSNRPNKVMRIGWFRGQDHF